MLPASITNIGDVLAGKYRVDRILGIGGMGIVVEAMHLELDQRVALKFMLPEALTSVDTTNRFLREARAAVRLRSEHICRVIDVGRLDNGAPYIVMELLEGYDFAHLLRHGPLPITKAVAYLLQASSGIAEAHANGIVHRDLKPGNLFLTTGGDGEPLVKVLDFGISKSGGSSTKTNDVMGSPAYMAPEQMASSKRVDARADVWALGVILYQAVSGKLPFEGESLPQVCMSVMSQPAIPVSRMRPDLPPDFAAVLMRCLEKQPEDRYQSVGTFAAALAPFGPPGSEDVALRIAKVLRRSAPNIPVSASGSALPSFTTSDTLLTPDEGATSNLRPSVQPIGRDSTLKSSAAEVALPGPSPRRSRTGVIVGTAAAIVALGTVAVFMLQRGDGSSTIATSAPPPIATPVSPPIAPPIVASLAPAARSAPATPVPTPREAEAPAEPDPVPARIPAAAKPTTGKHGASKVATKRTKVAARKGADAKVVDTKVVDAKVVDAKVAETKIAEPDPKPDAKPDTDASPKAGVEIKATEIPMLPRTTVDGVARSHGRDLAKCEGGQALRGEVTVRFQVDAGGKVATAQLSSSIRKPLVAGCILRSVQHWSFPKTATGARGTYTIVYQ